jgi:hypothetical protein
MTLRQPRKKLIQRVGAGLFLSLRRGCLCLGRLGLRLHTRFFLCLTIRFQGPLSGLFSFLARTTESAGNPSAATSNAARTTTGRWWSRPDDNAS